MIREPVDRRVLGAVRFVDETTGAAIDRPLWVSTEATVFRQRSGLLVIADAPGLREHTEAFAAPPADPPLGDVKVPLSVSDPANEYHGTTVTLELPRSPDPQAANAVHKPIDVKLWRTGAAPLSPNWTVYSATLLVAGTETPIAGALVTLAAGTQALRALSDATGQVTLALVGQPLFALTGGGTLSRTLDAQVDVRLPPPGTEALADRAAEIDRLAAETPKASFTRTLPTGAVTQQVVEVIA